MQAPNMPQTGKDGKVFLSFNDGVPVVNFPVTLQALYRYMGKSYTDRFYLLGGTKMINSRSGIDTRVTVDGIIDGLDIAPTANADEIAVTAGTIQVAAAPVPVAADTSVAVTRPASGKVAYVAVAVDKTTGAISATKGTDGDTLAATFGSSAGQKPLIGVGELLLGYLPIDSTAGVIEYSEINLSDREFSNISLIVYPSIGGILLSTALKKCHTGGIGRALQFTGNYFDDDMLAEVGDAQNWSMKPISNTVSVTTMAGGASQTNISGWNFTFNQLFTDGKVLDSVFNRNGFAAVKLQLPSGHFFRFAGSMAGGPSNDPGAYVAMDVSGSIADNPYFSGM